jgi:hypothetical protein
MKVIKSVCDIGQFECYATQSFYLGRLLVTLKTLFLYLQYIVLISMITCYNKNKEATI